MPMSNAKIEEVLLRYDVFLKLIYNEELMQGDPSKYAHMRGMIPQMRDFLSQGRREKVMRWIGFIQGALWMDGYFTVEQLAEHNRPDNEE